LNSLINTGDKAPNFQFDTPWKPTQDFYECLQQDVVLVFLRYQGCPVCQMEMAKLKRDIDLFKKKDARVFVFLQSPVSTLVAMAKEEDWPFDIVCDPDGKIFKLYGVEAGGIFKYLHPAGLVAAIKATTLGFHHKKFEGKETQLPAAFIVKSNKSVKYAYYGNNISDVPSPLTLSENID